MSGKQYTEEFKTEAVKKVAERAHPIAEAAGRLGVTTDTLYSGSRSTVLRQLATAQDQQAELRRLKVVIEERDILRKAATYFAKTSG